jgi:hypothetical protein
MKRALLSALFLTVFPLAAEPVADPAPVLRREKSEVVHATAALLAGSMDLRPDGTARTTHQIGHFSTRIELKGLAVREIVKLPVSADDTAKGVTRRFEAKLSCQAHRIWDGPMVSWSEWRESGYGFLPASIVVEEVWGTLQASAPRLQQFSPGIDGAITASAK